MVNSIIKLRVVVLLILAIYLGYFWRKLNSPSRCHQFQHHLFVHTDLALIIES